MRLLSRMVLLSLVVAGCAPVSANPIVPAAAPVASDRLPVKASLPEATPLPAEPKAPAIHNTVWLNTEPLSQDQLNGHVVLIDFWTFGCINCLNTIPALRELYQEYQRQGLILVGVHSPEFDYEHDVNNVKDAIARLQILYPVAIDNDFATWNAFGNHYWPALYLIDKRGVIRSTHIGELHANTSSWTEMTALIDTLLKE